MQHALVACAVVLLPAVAGAQPSFNLCDQADRGRFQTAARNTFLGGVVERSANPGQTLTLTGGGFLALRAQDYRVRLMGARPNVSNTTPANLSCYFGPTIIRLVTPTVVSDSQMRITLPEDLIWGSAKPVAGLYNLTNIDLVYQSPPPCTDSDDHFGGIVSGLSYRPDPPSNLRSVVRNLSEYQMSWDYTGDSTAITGFRVYEVFCDSSQRACIIPNPTNFKNTSIWKELTNPPTLILDPASRTEPIVDFDQFGQPAQGGRSFITMTADSKHCEESVPSRMLDTRLTRSGGGLNEVQRGTATITIGYYLTARV